MNALFIYLDNNLLREKGGDSPTRHQRYSNYFNKLNVIVFTKNNQGFSKVVKKNNLYIFPTDSVNKWFYIWDAFQITKQITREQKIHIVSAQDPFATAAAAILIKLKTGAHLNVQIHNDFNSFYWKNESLQNRVFSLLLHISLRLADSIRAVSKITADSVPSGKKVFIAPISVDTDFFHPSQKVKKTINIISVGRLVKQKNFPLLIRVTHEVVKQHPKINVVIVGEGPEHKSLTSLISILGLEENIKLIGAKSREEIRDLLRQARIFVLPSNYEGWGLAAVEAAACGLPVIMTDTGGAREIIKNRETGYIIPVGDREALTGKLQMLLENTGQAEKMGNLAGKKIISEKFNKDSFIIKLLKTTNTPLEELV